MKHIITLKNFRFLFIFIIISNFINSELPAQSKNRKQLFESYQKSFESPREVSYAHLNKSTYIKGEMLGLSAYVFDKTTSKLSTNSTNLYCTIEDKSGKRIKEDLMLLVKGVSNTTFKIDSLFTTGNYTLKVYTNWMRNFDEQNYFISNFSVIDPEITKEEPPIKSEIIELDIKALPEGGHAIYGVQNTYGIIVKNQYGQGVPYLRASLIENNKDTISSFRLNQFGIGKTILKPKSDNSYKILVKRGDDYFTAPITDIKTSGISMSVNTTSDKTLISIFNNKNTNPKKNYKLVIHNGKEINAWDFKIDSKINKVNQVIDNKQLYPGINIITVFDEKNNPLLERLIFSYKDIKTNQVDTVLVNKSENDSTQVSLKLKNIDINKFNSLSVSVLPSETKSYNHKHNILSYSLFQPYVKGHVENPKYYFSNINEESKYNLDLLLITQGWSSYKWNSIFGTAKKPIYPFEQGISFNAKINNKKTNEYFISPLRNSKSFLVNLEEDDQEFDAQALFPIAKDKLEIYGLSKKGKPIKPSLYLTFSPKAVPDLDVKFDKIRFINNNINVNLSESSKFSLDDETEKLDEVVINAKKKEITKYEKLKRATAGRVVVFDKYMRRDSPDFATWIASQGFNVVQNLGILQILNQRRNTLGATVTSPLVFLDGVLLQDLNVLYNFRMDTVDYIEIDRNAFTLGVRGNFGVIRIKTNPRLILEDNPNKNFSLNTQTINFPLTFSSEKKFYTPKYQYYDSKFFKEYGVIDWFPNVSSDDEGTFNFYFYSPSNVPLKLFIEGITNNNEFVSQTVIVEN